MQPYKCVIVEDEPLAVNVLKDYLLRVVPLELRCVYRDAVSAGHHLRKEDADILFLDIHLPELKGLDFLRTLPSPPAVIVTTAYHQYAIESFELSVTDYLLKPFSFDRFLMATNKAIHQINARKALAHPKPRDATSLFLTIDRKKVKIVFDEILYIESSREYVKIFTEKTIYTSKISISELETMLPPTRFSRIHRSYIVSIDRVESYTKEQVEIKGNAIPIGKAFAVNLKWGE